MSYQKTALYPQVIQSNPDASATSSSSSSLYPSLDMKDLVENLFPDMETEPSAPPQSIEETLIEIPGAILHLIDRQYSVELACGDFSIICLRQGDNVIAVLARVADEIQWPLAKDEASVKLDDSHYFFSLRTVNNNNNDPDDVLNYGLTFASKGQDLLLNELDNVLNHYSSFTKQEVVQKDEVLDATLAKEMSPADLVGSVEKREMMEERCAAYWTTLAPNVEDYSGSVAKMIAAGSGQLIKGILWCGDVTVDRLKWGNEVMKKRMVFGEKSQVSPQTLKRIER